MHLRIILIFFVGSLFISCSKDNEVIYKETEIKNPYTLYKEGYDAFKKNDFYFANKKFTEAEISFDSVELAAKSAIMSCFSLYGINFYGEALSNIDRFIKTYPADKNLIYAEYLKALIFFEQISDERKDIKPLKDANKQINYFIKKYPNSEYTMDLIFKNDLIENQLAAKELYVAKYYISIKKWIPAINRLKTIIKDYDSTVFVEEALHRLVELHFFLGLEEEAEKYAAILGYNYNSSDWFKQSYKVLNKDYVIKKKSDKKSSENKEGILKKITEIFK